jgi:gliotoxin biosynthesis cytochrome P450 monooxygenase
MQRLVAAKKGLTLSPTVHLPRGTFVSFAHSQTQRSATLPQRPLDEFHPFRYTELRSVIGEENKHQFVSTSLDSLAFGYGQHACPGRFFASSVIKLLLIELIKKYDIALGPKGDGAAGELKRPSTLTVGMSFIPHPGADIYLRRRAGGEV